MLHLRKRADREKPLKDGVYALKHVELVGDAPRLHNFADTFVQRASAEGWLEFKNPRAASTETTIEGRDPETKTYSRGLVMTGDEIVLKLKGRDLRYTVLEHPGRYKDGDSDRETHEYRCRLVGKAR